MNDLDPIEEALMADDLKAVCGRLVRDIVGQPVEIETLKSDAPVFVIRSANPTLFKSFIDQVGKRIPQQKLVIVSHEKDRKLVEECVVNPVEFASYPEEGPYSLETFSQAFPNLKSMAMGGKVMLDVSGTLSGLDNVVGIMDWIQGERTHVWTSIGPSLIELRLEAKRERARKALQALSSWNAARFG